MVVVDGGLADDAVKVPAFVGHATAGGDGPVALGIEQQIAVGLGVGVEPLRHQDRRAVKGGPGLPALVLKAKQGLFGDQADDVDAEGVHEVGRYLAQHLVGFDDLDRHAGRVEAQCLAQQVEAADVDAGDGAGAQVERDAVRFLVIQGKLYALSRIHV